MQPRSRQRDLRTSVTGTRYFYLTGTTTRTVSHGTQSWCDDVVGNIQGVNPLTLTHRTTRVPTLSGSDYLSNGQPRNVFAGYPVTWVVGPKSPLGPFPVPDSLTLIGWANKVAAQTNPSTPHVSVPTFFAELRDLPSLLRGWGRQLFKDAVQLNILDRWILRPLLSDVNKMLSFQKAVDDRFRYLAKLGDGKYISRRVFLDRGTASDVSNNVALQTAGCYVYADRKTSYTKSVWGVGRWKRHTYVSRWPQTDRERLNKAFQLVYGITTRELLATVWELIPWSWMIDWYLHVSDFVAQHNNSLELYLSDVSICRTVTSKSQYDIKPPPLTSPWITVRGTPEESEVRLERYVFTESNMYLLDVIGLLPRVPMLTAGQWSILGSLAVLGKTRRFNPYGAPR